MCRLAFRIPDRNTAEAAVTAEGRVAVTMASTPTSAPTHALPLPNALPRSAGKGRRPKYREAFGTTTSKSRHARNAKCSWDALRVDVAGPCSPSAAMTTGLQLICIFGATPPARSMDVSASTACETADRPAPEYAMFCIESRTSCNPQGHGIPAVNTNETFGSIPNPGRDS